jgi:hypothetical protein
MHPRDARAIKAASAYLQSYRAGTAPAASASCDDGDGTILSPEQRETRARSAVILQISGRTAEARRLVNPLRPWPRGRK